MHEHTENVREPQAIQLFSKREPPLMYVVTTLTPGPPLIETASRIYSLTARRFVWGRWKKRLVTLAYFLWFIGMQL